jgi:hypothetical protein
LATKPHTFWHPFNQKLKKYKKNCFNRKKTK